MTSNLVLMLKIFTVDRTTGKVAFLGCSVMELMDNNTNKLRAGGHQIKVFSGLPPPPKGGPLALRETDTVGLPVLPGTSITLRILHHDDEPSPRPHYRSGYYASSQAPSALETKLHKHYFSLGDYPIRLSSAISMLSTNGETDVKSMLSPSEAKGPSRGDGSRQKVRPTTVQQEPPWRGNTGEGGWSSRSWLSG